MLYTILSPQKKQIPISYAPKDGAVKIELFDLKGALLKRPVNGRALPGSYWFDIMSASHTANAMTVRVSIGRRVSTFRCLPFHSIVGRAMSASADAFPAARRETAIS